MIRLRNFVALNVLLLASAIQAATPNIGTLNATLSSNGKNVNLRWNSSPGQLQQIQISPDLLHWTNLPPVYFSAFTNSAWSDDGSLTSNLSNSQPRFYRLLRAQPAGESPGTPITCYPPASGRLIHGISATGPLPLPISPATHSNRM